MNYFPGILHHHTGTMMTKEQGVDERELCQICENVTSRSLRLNIDSVSDAYIKAILKCIEKSNSVVEELRLNRGTLNSELCFSLAGLIESTNCLKVLHFRNVCIDDPDAALIFQKIAVTPYHYKHHHSITTDTSSIEELYLESDCSSGINNCTNNAFISMLKSTNTSLTKLHVTGCELGYEGAIAIAKALEYNHKLRALVLENTNLMPGVGDAFRKLLYKNQTLQSLIFFGNPLLTPNDTRDIFRGLQSNNNLTLRILAVQGNKIDYETSQAIAKTIRTNSTLKNICLWSNDMGPEEASVIADSLRKNKALKELRLRMNPIGDDGVQNISKTLRINTSLDLLDLSFTGMTDTAARSIVDTLKDKNFVLKQILLQGNLGISKETKDEIDYYLHLNRSLRRIWHSKNFPLSLWSSALRRVNNENSLLFEALRNKPDLVNCKRNNP